MNLADRPGGFERWLDRELSRAIADEVGPAASPPPLRMGRRADTRLRTMSAAAVAAFALVLAGGAAMATGRPNPVSWGHQVIESVSTGALAPLRSPTPAPVAAPTRSAPRVVPTAPAEPAPVSDANGDQPTPSAPTASPQPPGQSHSQNGQGQNGQGQNGQGQSNGKGHKKGQNQQ
jgi:hypothetical protein